MAKQPSGRPVRGHARATTAAIIAVGLHMPAVCVAVVSAAVAERGKARRRNMLKSESAEQNRFLHTDTDNLDSRDDDLVHSSSKIADLCH
jgi:hypothetical protein